MLSDGSYAPARGTTWERRSLDAVGMDPERVKRAVDTFAMREAPRSRDLARHLSESQRGKPDSDIVGPVRERGGPNGLIVRGGYVVAEWGDTQRPDMVFSVTKSCLSTVAAIAIDDGLIRDVRDRVSDYVDDESLTHPQNEGITWHHLLQQTSEWTGTLWGKPDTADRRQGIDRTLQAPGTFWEYNDVRVNFLALQLLRVFGRSVPSVFRERVMDPIGASAAWEWHGYETSWLDVGGRRVQSVSGGGHWGGGMFVSSEDLARFGLLFSRRGAWGGRRVFSEAWVDAAARPGDVEPTYGYMWWLNTHETLFPGVPATTFAANGGNTNMVWVVPDMDLVVVARWMDDEARGPFIAEVVAATRAEV